MILGSLPFLQFDSTGIALLCAVAIIASEALSVEEAAQAIHVPTLSAGLVSLNASHQTSDCRGRLLVAATCLTSVSSDRQLTGASPTFEPERRLCDVDTAHAGVSAIPVATRCGH
jgi:hypothetical protein